MTMARRSEGNDNITPGSRSALLVMALVALWGLAMLAIHGLIEGRPL